MKFKKNTICLWKDELVYLLKGQKNIIRFNRIIKSELQAKKILSTESLPDAKVIFHVHLYHLSYLIPAFMCIKNFPQANFVISVRDQRTQNRLAKIMSLIGKSRSVRVQAVGNGGRNFGPILNEFSTRILQADLLVHLHSKAWNSSLTRMMWSVRLWTHLGVSKKKATAAISQFNNPRTGMISPFSAKWMPRDFSWSGNFELANFYFPQLRNHYSEDEVVYFPVGGMFISRVAPIRAILSNKLLSESLLPQNVDLSAYNAGIAPEHMIERLIGVLINEFELDQLVFLCDSQRILNSNLFLDYLKKIFH
jgi:hypothetical protein